MLKPKNIIFPFTAGFVLSFFISIVSTGNFSSSLLRALVFGGVFSVLGIVFSFLDSRFLNDGVSDVLEESSKNPSKPAGSVVDITIDDENLTQDNDAPSFSVSDNVHRLSEEETSVPEPSAAVQTAAPVAKSSPDSGTAAGSGQSAAEKIAAENQAGAASSMTQMQEVQEIEDLPDFTPTGTEQGKYDDSVLEDTEFAGGGSLPSVEGVSSKTEAAVKGTDATTIASAIRTLLKREE